MAAASILMTNPTTPMAPMPMKQILIDSQSSVLPGFMASFRVRAHWERNVLSLWLMCYSLFKFDLYVYVLMRITWNVCINFSLCIDVEGLCACVQRPPAPQMYRSPIFIVDAEEFFQPSMVMPVSWATATMYFWYTLHVSYE